MCCAGLLLGQGGVHQKHLETKTGCRIMLRGAGTSRAGDLPSPEDSEPLHVVIVGHDDAAMAQAEELVRDIFVNKNQAKVVVESGGSSFVPGGGGGYAGSGTNNTPLGGGTPGASGAPIMPGLALVPAGGTQEQLEVQAGQVGLIIGRGGERISQLEASTQCRIQLQRDTDVPPGAPVRICVLTGMPESVAQAKAAITQLLAADSAASGGAVAGDPRPAGSFAAQIHVPDGSVGMVIGRGGSNVNDIQRRTGTHVQIPKELDPAMPGHRLVVVTGPSQEACDTARAEIQGLLEAEARGERPTLGQPAAGAPLGPPMAGHWNGAEYVTECDVPDDRIGPVIGRQGSAVKDLQMRTGTHINIREGSDAMGNRRITIRGSSADGAEAAKNEILQKIENTRPMGGSGPSGANSFPQGAPQGGFGGMGGYGAQGGYGGMGGYGAQGGYGGMGGYGAQPQQQAYGGQQQPVYGTQGAQAAASAPASAQGAAPAAATSQAGAGAGTAPAASEAEARKAWIEYYKQYGYEFDEKTQTWVQAGQGQAAAPAAAGATSEAPAAAAPADAGAPAPAAAGEGTAADAGEGGAAAEAAPEAAQDAAATEGGESQADAEPAAAEATSAEAEGGDAAAPADQTAAEE